MHALARALGRISVEVVEARRRDAKHYALPDGRHVALIGGTPLHDEDLGLIEVVTDWG